MTIKKTNHRQNKPLKTNIKLKDQYYTIYEVADILKVHHNTIRRAINDNRLNSKQIQFIKMLIDYVIKNGTISLQVLTEDPFSSLGAVSEVFEDNIGAFKDIFELKKYIEDYAKYLGLNPDEVIDEFNEFMFEKTSKIPMSEIEKAAKEKRQEEANDKRVATPYTKAVPIQNNKQFIITIIIVIILAILAVVWSVKQITFGNMTTNILEYFK